MLALSALNPTEWWLKLRSNTLRVGPACLRAAIDVIAHHDGPTRLGPLESNGRA
jgi:hypothetical protein